MRVTDQQVRRLFRLDRRELPKGRAAAQAGLDEKTARKYRRLGQLPSEVGMAHTWRTREDPFDGVWAWVEGRLPLTPPRTSPRIVRPSAPRLLLPLALPGKTPVARGSLLQGILDRPDGSRGG